jgi:hypothetical protein
MSGYLLDLSAIVHCEHAGLAQPTVPQPRVKIHGQPVVTQPGMYTVTGCILPPQNGGPCVSAHWVTAAARVKVAGQPVVLADSHAICVPTGTPLTVAFTQSRVKGI